MSTAVIGATALFATTVPTQAATRPAVTYGGTVKVGIFDTFPGFCIGNNLANSALMSARTMYETLFEKTVGGDMVGLLATGATPSDDLKTWTVTLRSGVKFHDGTDFNAAAVVTNYNYRRGLAYLAGVAAGRDARYTLSTSVSFLANVNNVVAVDNLTVRFTLDRPQNDLPANLYASGRGFIFAPSQLASATNCATKPSGTGPFKLVSWTSNQLVVTRNTDYWRTDPQTGAKLPYLDGITFENVKEGSQRAAAVRKGTYDAAMFTSATDATFIKDLRQRRSVVKENRSAAEYYPSIWLNQGKAGSPFANRDARLALAYGFDGKSYVKVRTKGQGQYADSIVGPKSVMYSRKGFIKYDLKKARAAAARYKATTGKQLEFTFPVDVNTVSMSNAKFLQKMWAKAGIKMNLVTQETAVIISTAFNTATGSNDYDALALLLLEGTDVSFNLPFLVSNTFAPGSTNPAARLKPNFGALLSLSHHSDTVIDNYLFAGQAAKSRGTARAEYAKATARLQSEAVIIPTQRQYYSIFSSKKLNGIGTLQLVKGKTQRIMTNWGIDWTGVWKKA